MRKLTQISFSEAIERAKQGEEVFAVDMKVRTPKMSEFGNMRIKDAIEKDVVFQIVEEDENND